MSITWLRKNGYMRPGSHAGTVQWKNALDEVTGSIDLRSMIGADISGGGYVRLFYTITDRSSGKKGNLDYQIGLSTSPCHYGGVRYWFLCPLAKDGQPCQRRTTKLYLTGGAGYFGCRVCYDLTYKSCQEHDSGLIDW